MSEQAKLKCPDCGSVLGPTSFSVNGWYVGTCHRRWHKEHGWEPVAPKGCLRRQVRALKAVDRRWRAEAKQLPSIIDAALESYHMTHHKDHDGNGMLLCDALSSPLASTVRSGLEEIRLLHDHICGAILDSTREITSTVDDTEADDE